MSHSLIQRYLNDLSDLRRVSGTNRETVVREAFKTLLKSWGRSQDLVFIPEYEIAVSPKERRYVDGALVDQSRLPLGFWEAKDERDDLNDEIATKFRRGYPQENIIFEDSREAILIQDRKPVLRCEVDQVDNLERLLNKFFQYESPPSIRFRKAVEQFKADLPDVLETLRLMIEASHTRNAAFRASSDRFLRHVKTTIHPGVSESDVREMLIQHVLTEDIFAKVFDQDDFHKRNNVAKELYKLEATFFTGDVKWQTLNKLAPYYSAIHSAAAEIRNHHEKQTFLKVIYQGFYQVYNKKLADRLGVVYTPNEIVRFMIESADWLCQRHFQKRLIEKNVEILDPAAGTGTFITELIEYFRGQPAKLRHKYLEEVHANEVAILPYYVANLNIETTYATLTNEYVEYPNLCFVDTLDSTEGLGRYAGHQSDLFGAVSEENYERIKRQNKRKISVVIGNPPYNANQLNENENNKNRPYPEIDRRIRETYVKASSAQKTKLYDMYSRFFRWASDRVAENGIVAFVSNSSFVDGRTFDGFRKILAQDFNEIWIIDLKGNARTSGERRQREGGNIFDDQIRVGVAVYFCVKKQGEKGCRIRYEAVRDYAKSDEKRDFLTATPLRERPFEEVIPDTDHNWINLSESDFENLVPVASVDAKGAAKNSGTAIFQLYSNGIVTARDEWAYDADEASLRKKVAHFARIYSQERVRWLKSEQSKINDPVRRQVALRDFVSREIKWTAELEAHLDKGTPFPERMKIRPAPYRPFVQRYVAYARVFTHRVYRQDEIFPIAGDWDNIAIGFSGLASKKPFQSLAVNAVPSFDLLEKTQFLPRFRYHGSERTDNITDWALRLFRSRYNNPSITKDAIFKYVYAVFHDPVYRSKYGTDLRRKLPSVPLYKEFDVWVRFGGRLLKLHTDYQSIAPWPIKQVDATDKKSKAAGLATKAILKAEKASNIIYLNGETQLLRIPESAWKYKFGNRSALEIILDRYGEHEPSDPTVRDKFNCYRFSEHKEEVIRLIKRVTRVSVETMEIIGEMETITARTQV